jgi:ribonuclease P protein component
VRRDARLGAGTALERVFKEGVALSNPLFVWRSARNEAGRARWAFAVGKRLAPLAVTRNAVRRRMRAAARQVHPTEGWDVVLIAKYAALTAGTDAMADAISELCERARRASRR